YAPIRSHISERQHPAPRARLLPVDYDRHLNDRCIESAVNFLCLNPRLQGGRGLPRPISAVCPFRPENEEGDASVAPTEERDSDGCDRAAVNWVTCPHDFDVLQRSQL